MARKISQEQYAQFKRISEIALVPRYVDTAEMARQKAMKTYSEGSNSLGGETLDASKYDVCNVMQAVELFSKRTGL